MKKVNIWLVVGLVGIIAGLLLTDLTLTIKMSREIKELKSELPPRRSLPCESVPLGWAVENYDCANSLLWAMNVTNVKYLPSETHGAYGNNKNNSVPKTIVT